MTLAQRYNIKVKEIGLSNELLVDYEIDSASHIDEVVFRRSEYLGGMCHVVLKLIEE